VGTKKLASERILSLEKDGEQIRSRLDDHSIQIKELVHHKGEVTKTLVKHDQAIGYIEKTIDEIKDTLVAQVAIMTKSEKTMRGLIAKLSAYKNYMVGGITVLMALATFIVKYLDI